MVATERTGWDCGVCGRANREKDPACRQCRTARPRPEAREPREPAGWECGRCGRQNRERDRSCPLCGTYPAGDGGPGRPLTESEEGYLSATIRELRRHGWITAPGPGGFEDG